MQLYSLVLRKLRGGAPNLRRLDAEGRNFEGSAHRACIRARLAVYEARCGLASYPGPFTRAVRAAWERDKGLVPVVRACVEFYWNPGKIVFFGIF